MTYDVQSNKVIYYCCYCHDRLEFFLRVKMWDLTKRSDLKRFLQETVWKTLRFKLMFTKILLMLKHFYARFGRFGGSREDRKTLVDQEHWFQLVVGKFIFRSKKIGGSRKVNWWVRNFRPTLTWFTWETWTWRFIQTVLTLDTGGVNELSVVVDVDESFCTHLQSGYPFQTTK